MAGLGETCSHVASTLWAVEAGVRLRDLMTVTQKKAYWVIPNKVKDVPYSPVRDIHFIGKKKSETIMSSLSSPSPSLSSSISSPSHTNSSPSHHSLSSGEEDAPAVPHPSHSDMTDFYEGLVSLSSKPAILSLIEPHSSNYVPDLLDDELPLCLSGLLKHEYMKYSYSALLKLSQGFTHTVTPEQAEALAIRTHSQAKSSLWFRMRAGRITASNFKSVSHTDESSPSLSLKMSICHPEILNLEMMQQLGAFSMKN